MEQKILTFVVPGTAVPKARPKFSRYGTYTPYKTRQYEMKVRECFHDANPYWEPSPNACELIVVIKRRPPKSTSKKRLAQMLDGIVKPTTKPDLDNCLKAISDGLNGICYVDDSQVCHIDVIKSYGEEEKVEVCVMFDE